VPREGAAARAAPCCDGSGGKRVEALARQMRGRSDPRSVTINFGGEGRAGRPILGIPASSSERAVIDAPGLAKQTLDSHAAGRADAPVARPLCRSLAVRHALGGLILPSWVNRARFSRSMGRQTWSLSGRCARVSRHNETGIRSRESAHSAAPFAHGMAPSHCPRRSRACIAAGDARFGGVFIVTGPNAPAT
jgi:hypothetical protein